MPSEWTALMDPVLIPLGAAKLDALDATDPEMVHAQADAELLSWVPAEIREAYLRLVDRAPWWAHARHGSEVRFEHRRAKRAARG